MRGDNCQGAAFAVPSHPIMTRNDSPRLVAIQLWAIGTVLVGSACRTKLELPEPDGEEPPAVTAPLPGPSDAAGDRPRADAPAGITRVVETIDRLLTKGS